MKWLPGKSLGDDGYMSIRLPLQQARVLVELDKSRRHDDDDNTGDHIFAYVEGKCAGGLRTVEGKWSAFVELATDPMALALMTQPVCGKPVSMLC
jgi:hypothetical protein